MRTDFIKELEALLIVEEGDRGQAYDDATSETLIRGKTVQGNVSIGHGRNLIGKPLTKAERLYLLKNDMADAVIDATIIFGYLTEYGRARAITLLELCFQMGYERMLTFKKMIAAVKEKNWEKAAEELLDSDYGEQNPNRAKRQAKRLRENSMPDKM